MSTKPITNTFALLHGGAFIDDASEQLAKLVKNVDETGKPGSLTIKLVESILKDEYPCAKEKAPAAAPPPQRGKLES